MPERYLSVKLHTVFLGCILILLVKHGLQAQNEHNFGFHGYMRAGFGLSGNGDAFVAFRAPNSEAKYRLGNEAETYVEALFQYFYEDENGALFETNLRLAFVTPTSKSNQFTTTTSVREAYARITGVVKNKPGMGFWAGQRFYDRYDAHLNDFWYRDMSGFGGGMEDLNLGRDVKLSVAFLGGSIDQLTSNGTVQPENTFSFNKVTMDVTIYDIDVGFGKLGVTGDLSSFKGDSVLTDSGNFIINSSGGWSLGVFHQLLFKKGRNRLVFFYGTGAAENYKAIIQQPLGVTIQPDVPLEIYGIKRFRVLNDFLVDFNKRFSMMALVVYQRLDNSQEPTNKLDWYSIGWRPSVHFGRYFSLVGEFGFDYTYQSNVDQGWLFKMTIAPQLQPLNKILTRPAIRAFFTYAFWSDSYVGDVASFAFPDQNHGFTFGIQMESWW